MDYAGNNNLRIRWELEIDGITSRREWPCLIGKLIIGKDSADPIKRRR